MRTRLLYLWEFIRASFWFIPLLMILLAMVLAVTLTYVDSLVEIEPDGIWRYLLTSSAESARNLLTLIAGAMLGIAGTVFSITLVALTLASSQFGPRMLRNFMEDRLNQVTLGAYVATFTYCLVVLRSVHSGDDSDFSFLPNIPILFAMLLALASIVLLIFFFHHISKSIQADQVISDIDRELRRQLHRHFPEKAEEQGGVDKEASVEKVLADYPVEEKVKSREDGYIQLINYDDLLHLAEETDSVFVLSFRAGDFVVEGADVAVIHADKKPSEELQGKLLDLIVFGPERTPIQDVEFAIHQMVEIAGRALSPGINDPYTAIACIDKLAANLAYLLRVPFPSGCYYDEGGRLRIVGYALNFEGLLNAAFNQIRQYGQGMPAVLIHLLDALKMLMPLAQTEDHREAIRRHTRMIFNAGKVTFQEQHDLNDMKSRLRKILR